jgi:hypothetical protein
LHNIQRFPFGKPSLISNNTTSLFLYKKLSAQVALHFLFLQ